MNVSDTDLRQRIAASPLTQEHLAIKLGYDPTLFSRIIRGLRPAPDGFADRVDAMLDLLERAEAAAEEARARVLAEMAEQS